MEINPVSLLKENLLPHIQKKQRTLSVIALSWIVSGLWFTIEHWLSVQMGSKPQKAINKKFLIGRMWYVRRIEKISLQGFNVYEIPSQEGLLNKEIFFSQVQDFSYRIVGLLMFRVMVWRLSFKFLLFKKIDKLTPFSDSLTFSLTILLLLVWKRYRYRKEFLPSTKGSIRISQSRQLRKSPS